MGIKEITFSIYVLCVIFGANYEVHTDQTAEEKYIFCAIYCSPVLFMIPLFAPIIAGILNSISGLIRKIR